MKANKGYDPKQLLIGAEGTLGIVTGAVLDLVPEDQDGVTALVSCPGVDDVIDQAMFDGLQAIGGSFSAEHGIGLEKRAHLARLGQPRMLETMRAAKQVLDPAGIMNPGKVL